VERAVKKEWTENAWRGTPVGLADLLTETSRLVKQASGDDAEPSAHITVTLSRGEGELVFNAVADFEEAARARGATVARVKVLYAAIGNRVGDVGATLILRKYRIPLAGAVDAKVGGRNPVAVNGVAPEIKALLRVGGQRVPTWAPYWGAWALGLILMLVAIPVSGPSAGPVWIMGSVMAFGSVAVAILSPFVWPQFEVIDPSASEGGAARARRWLAGSGKWLLAAVAGAFIYAAVDHLF
jgi:hypothetical protein